MGKQTPPLLQVRGLSVGFGRYGRGFRKSSLAGVRDLSFTLNGGELLAVVGASGSGKSLLAHRILGILPANAAVGGQVLYEGRPLKDVYKRQGGNLCDFYHAGVVCAGVAAGERHGRTPWHHVYPIL